MKNFINKTKKYLTNLASQIAMIFMVIFLIAIVIFLIAYDLIIPFILIGTAIIIFQHLF